MSDGPALAHASGSQPGSPTRERGSPPKEERDKRRVLKGQAARIFRCKPDGSEVEVVCGGGMDNPVAIAFTAEGEPLVTVNILHHKPARSDAIIYAIEGGVWPWHEAYNEFPRTG